MGKKFLLKTMRFLFFFAAIFTQNLFSQENIELNLNIYTTKEIELKQAEHNYKLDVDKLYVKEAYVGKAVVLRNRVRQYFRKNKKTKRIR